MSRPLLVSLLVYSLIGCATYHPTPGTVHLTSSPPGATVEIKQRDGTYRRLGETPVDIPVEREVGRGSTLLPILVGLGSIGGVIGAAVTDPVSDPGKQERTAFMIGGSILAVVSFLFALGSSSEDGHVLGLSEDYQVRLTQRGRMPLANLFSIGRGGSLSRTNPRSNMTSTSIRPRSSKTGSPPAEPKARFSPSCRSATSRAAWIRHFSIR